MLQQPRMKQNMKKPTGAQRQVVVVGIMFDSNNKTWSLPIAKHIATIDIFHAFLHASDCTLLQFQK